MNRKILFDRLRQNPFRGSLQQQSVDGVNYIFDTWVRHYRDRTSVAQLATCLGQTFHETGGTMQPIKEYGSNAYFTRMYDIAGARPHVARTLGNTQPGDGAKFPGMGFIQSTGRVNARRNTQKLRALGIIGPDVDFEQTPELMMRPEYAVHIMFIGMEEGWFTGVKLDDVVDDVIDGDEFADFVKSRRIINGTDKAEMIASYSNAFLAALVAADAMGVSEEEVIPPPPGGKPGATLPATQQPSILPLILTLFLALAGRRPMPANGSASGPQQADPFAMLLPLLTPFLTSLLGGASLPGSPGAPPVQPPPAPSATDPSAALMAMIAQLLGGKPIDPTSLLSPQPPPVVVVDQPKSKSTATAADPWYKRTGVRSGLAALLGGVGLQGSGLVGLPIGEAGTTAGFLTNFVPIATMALGVLNTFSPVGGFLSGILGKLGPVLTNMSNRS